MATAGSARAQELEELGAAVTSYGEGMVERLREISPEPFDLVLDAAPTNPDSLPQLVQLTGDPERITTISNHAQAGDLGVHSNLVPTGRPITPDAEFVPEYARLLATGEFSLPVSATFPIAQWRDAVELSVGGRARGKIVLTA